MKLPSVWLPVCPLCRWIFMKLNISPFEESYDVATPVLTRTKPLLESADGLAVATWVKVVIWAVRVLTCVW